jgi:hypothetical protein
LEKRCSRPFGQDFPLPLDDFSAKTASELCGREDRLKSATTCQKAAMNASVSLLTGKAVSHRANITASKSYNTQTDFRFDMKTFTELRKRPVRHDCLRRTQSDSPDVLLPKTLLQRPEQILFRTACRRRTLMPGFDTILPFSSQSNISSSMSQSAKSWVNGPDQVFVEKAGFVETGSRRLAWGALAARCREEHCKAAR